MTIILYLIAAVYGLLIGNYVTSAYFRIPRNIPLNGLDSDIGQKPCCSKCGHELRFYEYLPLISWFSTGFKCNYCGIGIDPLYPTLEGGMMMISILMLYFIGMNMQYVVGVLALGSMILNIALIYGYRKIFHKSAVILAVVMLISGITLYGGIQ